MGRIAAIICRAVGAGIFIVEEVKRDRQFKGIVIIPIILSF